MCSEQSEKLLAQIVEAVTSEDFMDATYSITTSQPLVLDYKERTYLFVRSPSAFVFTLEDLGSLPVAANVWVNLGYQQGIRLYPSASVTVLVRATDTYIFPDLMPPSVGSAVAAYSGNPTQTAAGAADTLYKFGAGGLTTISHCVIQNNTGSSITYAFDQSSTVSTNMVYTLANAQTAFWDRAVSVLHFSSAAQQSFGGTSGITVEGFL